ncbi:PAQR family membrane homeostasis protein TrhA [Parerythrobacter jejuensis]|uniref:Hemolysin n=1 Tax=Parerythrobacter jejuensis TaxID=795812 RepID=A0A845AV17_9SPHN|nr:hemolysin III family protein [Parerythrobacter jejuensis]MXP32651.1 hemolysin [Parerythrobacter jejuensis]
MYPSKTPPERIADGIVHAIGLVGLLVAGVFLLRKTTLLDDQSVQIAAAIYVVAALFSISISFAYHLLPRHHWRATLRRWDHAAIYLVIAGTFSPLLVKAGTWTASMILAVIWLFALMGMWFKFFATEIDSRWSLVSYLGLGWFALIALPDFWAELPGFTTAAIAAGGIFYTIGTLFYRKKGLSYRYPIWHAFGTLGGGSFFAAIWVAISS